MKTEDLISKLIDNLNQSEDYLLIMLLKQKAKADQDIFLSKHTFTEEEYRRAKTGCKTTLQTIFPSVEEMFPYDEFPKRYDKWDENGVEEMQVDLDSRIEHKKRRFDFYDSILNNPTDDIKEIIKCKAIITKINASISYYYSINPKYTKP